MAAHRKSDRRPRWSLRGADFVIYACYDASRSRLRCRRVLTCLVESKPNSTMIKTNTISVMLIASSIIDKKWPRRGWRQEHRATGLKRRTRRKSSSLSLWRLDLSPCYYLKILNIDISQTREISCAIWIADAHRDGNVVRADEMLTAFLELESVISTRAELS